MAPSDSALHRGFNTSRLGSVHLSCSVYACAVSGSCVCACFLCALSKRGSFVCRAPCVVVLYVCSFHALCLLFLCFEGDFDVCYIPFACFCAFCVLCCVRGTTIAHPTALD
ncbi:hypothetical protein C7974DRAFT_383187 [Boeremia exigua]|uniref:uncharacterized protein n=1 Tax=Boeremia exigua TaxID=749465 RepID=UPI001E8DF97B|nr:uncharacterized protein C7974DRAFT_383187 [Boeremia exigua]KAH6644238.1 hypothetical protein C7974DRAFT_383187 [Boeremia exigua]